MRRCPLIRRIPPHVGAVEVVPAGTRFHAFRLVSQRDTWVAGDPSTRATIGTKDPRFLAAWEAFSIVLHQDPKKARKLWSLNV